jgi:hypothetical protein
MLSRKNRKDRRRKEMIKIDPFKRPFKASSRRRVDPLSSTSLALATPYTSVFLAHPIGAAIIISVGMAGTLYFLTVSFGRSIESGNELAEFLRRIDIFFALLERFVASENALINMLNVNMSNFSPEFLTACYSALKELVFLRESLFNALNVLAEHPLMDSVDAPVVLNINSTLENLRLGGNSIVILLREVEERLNIPANLRVPSFWFED